MKVTCFTCENLLSDFVEGVLPSGRHEELNQHIKKCEACENKKSDLVLALQMLKKNPKFEIQTELVVQVTEAAQRMGPVGWGQKRFKKISLYAGLPALLFAGVVFVFPRTFPFLTHFWDLNDESKFVRYFPLLQGASELIEQQSQWLEIREPLGASLWEEGGLSPEEFEKTFQKKIKSGETTE